MSFRSRFIFQERSIPVFTESECVRERKRERERERDRDRERERGKERERERAVYLLIFLSIMIYPIVATILMLICWQI